MQTSEILVESCDTIFEKSTTIECMLMTEMTGNQSARVQNTDDDTRWTMYTIIPGILHAELLSTGLMKKSPIPPMENWSQMASESQLAFWILSNIRTEKLKMATAMKVDVKAAFF
jgi:hypothetical protein